MKIATTIAAALLATAAAAHPGHIAPQDGHSHGEILAVLALVGIAGVIWVLRAR